MMRTTQALMSFAAVLYTGCATTPSHDRSGSGQARLPVPGEEAAAAHLERVRGDPNELVLFLRDMPKGGDLHSHLSGAVYAESFIRWGAEDGMCFRRSTLSLSDPPCNSARDEVPATQLLRDPAMYGDAIDAWSMRNWHPARESGHDQFFDSFSKFQAAPHRLGDMLAEVTARAADQNVAYLELMFGPDRGRAVRMGRRAGFDSSFATMRSRLLAAGLRDSLDAGRREIDSAEVRQRQLMGCGAEPAPAPCATVVRYLYQVARGLDPEAVFAQILAGFELASRDGRWVGFNLVMPEDHPVPMRDFRLHMRMIDYLHSLYPRVKITLHAGELAEGLVPPEGMTFHIRESMEQGHASRIGHGTAIAHETGARQLLQTMAERRILVEVSLSSSSGILGISGRDHPISTYLRHGVPVALATDDEGVSRTTLTREFRLAVEEQGLDYRTLKRMARNSIQYSFAEDSVRNRLLRELDEAFVKFEGRFR